MLASTPPTVTNLTKPEENQVVRLAHVCLFFIIILISSKFAVASCQTTSSSTSILFTPVRWDYTHARKKNICMLRAAPVSTSKAGFVMYVKILKTTQIHHLLPDLCWFLSEEILSIGPLWAQRVVGEKHCQNKRLKCWIRSTVVACGSRTLSILLVSSCFQRSKQRERRFISTCLAKLLNFRAIEKYLDVWLNIQKRQIFLRRRAPHSVLYDRARSLILLTGPDVIGPSDWLDKWVPIALIIFLPHFLVLYGCSMAHGADRWHLQFTHMLVAYTYLHICR